MAVKVGIPKETFAGEKRVSVIPSDVQRLVKAGLDVLAEAGAGSEAGYFDYAEKGAKIAESREDIFKSSDIILQIHGRQESAKPGQILIGLFDPLNEAEPLKKVASTGATVFALELLPRISRAQSMDVLSSMATISGYKAVLLAAYYLPKMFPMMMTAAGTLMPAKVFIIGAGVAGLQAIATARKLGAVVSAYDVRPAVKEQIESLGAKFIALPLETGAAEEKGGYAKELGGEFYKKQRELMLKIVSGSDCVITTALIPGKKSPVLVTADMVKKMAKGSVIVDLAASQGGNCELTKADEIVNAGGITILGPTNLPSEVACHASQMYSKNITSFLLNMIKNGAVNISMEDEIVSKTLVAKDGKTWNLS
ncbi:MAG: Re/Si-specific NAD(P)(+) transhydrogenase subunit alpha [Deltaproteobacteria bacterium]|nr:Re/Si-specific NAD(P)(+) transhydrogenase subunit alpha [Deltaproteobacteria bacterium]